VEMECPYHNEHFARRNHDGCTVAVSETKSICADRQTHGAEQ
jgi:hypothetical protein